jgi:hypothetical protein
MARRHEPLSMYHNGSVAVHDYVTALGLVLSAVLDRRKLVMKLILGGSIARAGSHINWPVPGLSGCAAARLVRS